MLFQLNGWGPAREFVQTLTFPEIQKVRWPVRLPAVTSRACRRVNREEWSSPNE